MRSFHWDILEENLDSIQVNVEFYLAIISKQRFQQKVLGFKSGKFKKSLLS